MSYWPAVLLSGVYWKIRHAKSSRIRSGTLIASARLESIGAKPYLIQRGKGGKGSEDEDEDGPIPDDVDPDDIKDTPEAAAG